MDKPRKPLPPIPLPHEQDAMQRKATDRPGDKRGIEAEEQHRQGGQRVPDQGRHTRH